MYRWYRISAKLQKEMQMIYKAIKYHYRNQNLIEATEKMKINKTKL